MAVPDLGAVDLDPHLQILYDAGWRSRARRADAARGADRRCARRAAEADRRLLRGDASSCWRRSPASRRWRSSTPGCSASSRSAAPSSRWPAGTSRSSWRACRTSCGRRSTRCSASPRCCWSGCSARSTSARRSTCATSGARASTCWSCSTRSSTCPRSRPGRWSSSTRPFELPPALDHAASMLRERAAAARHRRCVVEADDDVGVVEADELRLKQVVLNLMTNAVKFTGDGGSVVVRAKRSGADVVTITVTDTGIGIPPEDRERIFESFQQGGRGASQRGGDRPRADPVAADRRAARRADVARERGRGRAARSGSRIPASPTSGAGWRGREPPGDGPADVVRHRGRPAVARPPDGLPRRGRRSGSRPPGTASPGWMPSRADPARRGAPRHPAPGHGRVGRPRGPQGRRRRPGTSRSSSSRSSTSVLAARHSEPRRTSSSR